MPYNSKQIIRKKVIPTDRPNNFQLQHVTGNKHIFLFGLRRVKMFWGSAEERVHV